MDPIGFTFRPLYDEISTVSKDLVIETVHRRSKHDPKTFSNRSHYSRQNRNLLVSSTRGSIKTTHHENLILLKESKTRTANKRHKYFKKRSFREIKN